MKVYDTWNDGKAVEKNQKQFEAAERFYPNRFVKTKPKKDLPIKEEKED